MRNKGEANETAENTGKCNIVKTVQGKIRKKSYEKAFKKPQNSSATVDFRCTAFHDMGCVVEVVDIVEISSEKLNNDNTEFKSPVFVFVVL